jgi:lysozyme family protein
MKISRTRLKEIIKGVMTEESEYQAFFQTALDKAGKSIPSMSDDEKKAFFDKIDAAWNGKGEKNEELVGGQKKLDVDKDGDIGADDLADLRAGKKTNESINESKESDILAQIEKVRVASNSGKNTGDEFLNKFTPLWKQLKSITKESINED